MPGAHASRKLPSGSGQLATPRNSATSWVNHHHDRGKTPTIVSHRGHSRHAWICPLGGTHVSGAFMRRCYTGNRYTTTVLYGFGTCRAAPAAPDARRPG